MPIQLDKQDNQLVANAKAAIKSAYDSANAPAAVAKAIAVYAVRCRNRGRAEAKRRYPFKGICEASGKPLEEQDACLDEVDPAKGYSGPIRWVCPKANNSGRRSCGDC